MRPDLHALAEYRSLLLHGEVARRIVVEPSIVERALARLDSSPTHPEYAQAWRAALLGPRAELCALLTDRGERATAMRQSTPFAFVVDQKTRNRLWHEARAEWEAASAPR